MPLPVMHPSTTLAARQVPDGYSRAEGKDLIRRQNREETQGLVTGMRVETAGMVATVGLHMTAMLSREARFQADGDPATANRLNFIVDNYATFVGGEIAWLGHRLGRG